MAAAPARAAGPRGTGPGDAAAAARLAGRDGPRDLRGEQRRDHARTSSTRRSSLPLRDQAASPWPTTRGGSCATGSCRRLIENRIQLQQAEREKITVEDAEIQEQLNDIMKKVNAPTVKDFEEVLKQQGLTLDGVKKRHPRPDPGPAGDSPQGRPAHLRHRAGDRRVPRRTTARSSRPASRSRRATSCSCPRRGRGEERLGRRRARRRSESTGSVKEGKDFADAGQGVLGGPLAARTAAASARSSAASSTPEIEDAILRLQPGRVVAADPIGHGLSPVPSRLEGDALRRGARRRRAARSATSSIARSTTRDSRSGSSRSGSGRSSTSGCEGVGARKSVDTAGIRVGQ